MASTGSGGFRRNPKVTPGKAGLSPVPSKRSSTPAVPSTPKKFPGVKTPTRKATSKDTKPTRGRTAPKGTPLAPA